MFNDFTTLSYILSFPGMIVTVIFLTQFFKKMLDKYFENKTKYVVYVNSATLCLLAAVINGKFGSAQSIFETAIVWTINSVIIWFASMKAFEVIAEKVGETNE